MVIVVMMMVIMLMTMIMSTIIIIIIIIIIIVTMTMLTPFCLCSASLSAPIARAARDPARLQRRAAGLETLCKPRLWPTSSMRRRWLRFSLETSCEWLEMLQMEGQGARTIDDSLPSAGVRDACPICRA
eukprot:6199973-Pleurochrysis_carterae.AAC.1